MKNLLLRRLSPLALLVTMFAAAQEDSGPPLSKVELLVFSRLRMFRGLLPYGRHENQFVQILDAPTIFDKGHREPIQQSGMRWKLS